MALPDMPARSRWHAMSVCRNSSIGLGAPTASAAARSARARQIKNYHHRLGEGTFDELPPLVESRSKNYLTMAFEEIAEGKIAYQYAKS